MHFLKSCTFHVLYLKCACKHKVVIELCQLYHVKMYTVACYTIRAFIELYANHVFVEIRFPRTNNKQKTALFVNKWDEE